MNARLYWLGRWSAHPRFHGPDKALLALRLNLPADDVYAGVALLCYRAAL